MMEIESIQLENIGCFDKKTFDFKRLTVLHGANRTGKSTFVYGLFFALFNEHLNPGLTLNELVRMGERHGNATLIYRSGDTSYRLWRPTTGMPRLSKQGPDLTWQPIELERQDDLSKNLPFHPGVTALTSFFREGEIIYFLKDIPKYNQTLLESLMGFGDLKIVRSRFRKTLELAKSDHRKIKQMMPSEEIDVGLLERYRAELQRTESELGRIEQEYAHLLEQGPQTVVDPNVYRLLKQQLESKKKEQQIIRQMRDKLPAVAAMEKELARLKEAAAKPLDTSQIFQLERESGRLEQKIADSQARLNRIEQLSQKAACPTCDQQIPRNRLDTVKQNISREIAGTTEEQTRIKQNLQDLQNRQRSEQETQNHIARLEQQIHEAKRSDAQLDQIAAELAKIEAEFAQFERMETDLDTVEKHQHRKKEVENRRGELQKTVVDLKTTIRHSEDVLKRSDQHQAQLKAASKNQQLCQVAYEALDKAFQSLGSSLLGKVRTSIRERARMFTYLDQFDIDLTGNELIPIINAKGYQYKLNQMSKSERIFLYIMLKLAIGDALGHLGAFILDDPADGLDARRKEMLAYILTELSRDRQVIVTTNDPGFADQFEQAHRVEL